MQKVKVTMEDGGEFIIELYPEEAPITCENFLKLVKSGFYNGLTFHRVIDGFMAQGGDPEGTGCGGSKEQIKGEFKSNGVNNNLSHTRGVVSMARSQMPNSASSQFFICYDDSCTFLDGQYAAFGKVTEGMEVVDGFLKIERRMSFGGERSTPVTPIVMKTVEAID
ncbi:MAG: peptidylprolyl isomerase [Acutalibacteraceae bacterium]